MMDVRELSASKMKTLELDDVDGRAFVTVRQGVGCVVQEERGRAG
jgi:hypothetical protein